MEGRMSLCRTLQSHPGTFWKAVRFLLSFMVAKLYNFCYLFMSFHGCDDNDNFSNSCILSRNNVFAFPMVKFGNKYDEILYYNIT